MTKMEEMLKILRVPSDYKASHGTVMIDADSALKAMKAWGDKRFEEGRDKTLGLVADACVYYDGWNCSPHEFMSLKTHKDLQP